MTCPHDMPSAASCMDCINDEGLGAEPVRPERVEYAFTAQHDGDCGECPRPVVAGQRLVKTTHGRYLHTGCSAGMESV